MAEPTRREALRRIGGTALALGGVTALGFGFHDERDGDAWFRDAATADAVYLPRFDVEPVSGRNLAIIHGTRPDAMVRAGIGALGGIERFIRPGDIVVVKPNAAFDRGPALGATTSPEVLESVVKLVREAGAKQVRVADNPINQPEGCFHKSGLAAAAARAGAELVMPTPDSFQPLAVGRRREGETVSGARGEALDVWPMFHQPFRDATKVIGIAPCKDHNLCGASLTMKNWYGLLGGRRNQFHQQIHGIISDFPLMIQPTFVVLDATRILTKNGPTGGSVADVRAGDTIVIGTDMVAVDSYGYTLFERRQPPPEYLAKAAGRGLGTDDWRSLSPIELTV